MKRITLLIAVALMLSLSGQVSLWAQEKDDVVYPVAILPFEERGANVKDFGAQVSEVLFAELVANPKLMLVDRAELTKTLGEQSLSLTGAVKPDEAVKVGQLTGAKLIITGSVLQVDKKLYLVAKIMGTETTRVVGASVNGQASDELAPLIEKLAEQITSTLDEKASTLVAKPVQTADRIAALRKQLGDAKLPVVRIEIAERHVAQATIDPAAETEIAMICRELGFEVVDNKEAAVGAADILITGEGFSETVGRIGNLVSVRGRLEVKAVDRKTGKVLAIDRQTNRVIDASEQIAGKTALQEAAAALAERIIPKLVTPAGK
jgi:TolB-like protein